MSDNSTAKVTYIPEYQIPQNLSCYRNKLTEVLEPLVSSARMAKFRSVAATRSRRVLCVFEDTNHCHNISAILRTVDAMGFQDIVFLYESDAIKTRIADSVERGSSQWLCVQRSRSIERLASGLESQGYAICSVSMPTFHFTHQDFQSDLPSFDVQGVLSGECAAFVSGRPTALVFGNEKLGVSKAWNKWIDCYLNVKMFGFVESLNVSVCAALLLNALRISLVDANSSTQLSSDEQLILSEYWLTRSVDTATHVVQNRYPDLLPYLQFMRSGKFFDPHWMQ